jgi:4-carboxymuconolactone decarboxylase
LGDFEGVLPALRESGRCGQGAGGDDEMAAEHATFALGGVTMIQRKQRIPMRDLSTLSAEDRESVEKNAMNGRIFNIFKVLAHHPKLVKRWTPFAGHILGKQTLPFRDRELLILRIGFLNQAEYEFAQHELIAKKGGITDTEITRLQDGPKAAGWSEKESALLQVADDLFENSVVSDETWETLSKHYSTEQLMDAVFTVGQYNLVSWALNSFGVPLDDFLPRARP